MQQGNNAAMQPSGRDLFICLSETSFEWRPREVRTLSIVLRNALCCIALGFFIRRQECKTNLPIDPVGPRILLTFSFSVIDKCAPISVQRPPVSPSQQPEFNEPPQDSSLGAQFGHLNQCGTRELRCHIDVVAEVVAFAQLTGEHQNQASSHQS